MGVSLIFTKILGFLKKNWKVVVMIIGFFIVSGMVRRFIGRMRMWWAVRNYKEDSSKVDYNFLALSIRDAMSKGLFNLGENEGAITSFINTLKSQADFLELVRVYALKYGKDLRQELRDHFNDRQYSKLIWK